MPSARRKTGSGISCSAERNEELTVFVLWRSFLGSWRVLRVLPTMEKSAPFSEAFKGADLYKEGMYRKALSKFETALTAAPDEESIIGVRLWIISCHERLEQVSLAEYSGLG